MADETVDPLEEVLEQSSQQTLRLTHIDEMLKSISTELGDLSETMQAGFVELRQVASEKPPPAPAPAPVVVSRPTMTGERFDDLEQVVKHHTRNQGLLLTLVSLNFLVVIVLLLNALGVLKLGKAPEAPPAPVVVTPPTPVAPVVPEKAADPEPPVKGKKKQKVR